MNPSPSRGAERWAITSKNTALIVVDMQNIWLHPRGSRYLTMSEDIVPRIQELLQVCRSNQVPVIYLHTTKRKDLADVGIFADIKPQTHDADDEWSNFEGSPGAELYSRLSRPTGIFWSRSFVTADFTARNSRIYCAPWAATRSQLPVWPPTSAVTARRATAPCATSKSCFSPTATLLLLKRNRRRRSTTFTSISAW